MSYRQCLSGIGKLSVHAKDFKDTSDGGKDHSTTMAGARTKRKLRYRAGKRLCQGKEKDALKWLGYCEPDERPMEFFFDSIAHLAREGKRPELTRVDSPGSET